MNTLFTKRGFLFLLLLVSSFSLIASNGRPIITIIPANPTLDEPVDIIYDASQGNGKLSFYGGKMYAHTGVTTDNGDWQYATSWDGVFDEKFLMTPIGDNKWRLSMPDGIRAHYGIASTNEFVDKLAFVFRGEERTDEKVGKNTDGSDIFLDLRKPYFTIPNKITDFNQPVQIMFDPEYLDRDFGSSDIYVHTGVTTGDGDWKYATDWGDNGAKYKLKKVGKRYRLDLPEGINSFYNVASGELIAKMSFVLRNAAGSYQTADVFVDVTAPLIQASSQFPNDNDPLTISFNVAAGNKTLDGYTDAVYIHTGVITDKSFGNSDWKYATDWNYLNEAKQKLTKLNNGFYQIAIDNIRSYYNVPEGEVIQKLVFVLRNAAGDKVGKTAEEGDIVLPLYPQNELNLRFASPLEDKITAKVGEEVYVKGIASTSRDMTLSVGNDNIASKTNATVIDAKYSFDHAGIYDVFIASGETREKLLVEVLAETGKETIPVGIRPGINYHEGDDTKATLVLQAPYKRNVYVIGDFNDWEFDPNYQMKRDGELFWIELQGLTPGEEYAFQYVVDGTTIIADPYTDKVLDPWNDKYINQTYNIYPDLKEYPSKASGIVSVLQTGQTAYNWEVENFTRPQKDNLIIYELHFRDFTEEGSFNAAIEKLPYLKSLGVNAIQPMPINEFEGNDSWGYNPSFYFAVDKAYGTKNDFKKFVDECHKHGMAVIIDMVLNHSFGQSPLFNLYKDTDGKPSTYNPWYNKEHNLANPDAHWGVDFNHESFYTRALVDSVAHFWLKEYKVDGIRYDFTKGFSNTPYGMDDPWASAYDPGRVYNVKRMAEKVWHYSPGAYVILEHLTPKNGQEEKELAAAGEGIMHWRNMNPQYCQTAMGYSNDSDFTQLFDWDTHVQMPTNSLVGYMESHDEERMSFKAKEYGNASIKASLESRMKQIGTSAAFFLTVPGPKMIWQFGELGYDYSIDHNGRTGRKPIKWEFYDEAERKELYDTYAKLLNLRSTYPKLFRTRSPEAFQWYVTSGDWDNGRKLYARTPNGEKMIIVGNFTNTDKIFNDVLTDESSVWYEYMDNEVYKMENGNRNVTVGANDFKLFLNFDLPVKEIYTSDVRDNTKYANYSDEDDFCLRAGGWKDENITNLNTFLNSRNNDLIKTTIDLTKAEIDPTEISGIFDNSKTITSILLPKGDYSLTRLFNDGSNPNSLIYLAAGSTLGTNWKNVIIEGNAVADININDNGLFHFYEDFEVPAGKTITYTRTMKSAAKSTGWYTIALPFEPTNISSSALPGQNIQPVTDSQSGDFWLREYTGSTGDASVDFQNVPNFEKNKPYIIAFPGKYWGQSYPDEWTVSFSSTSGAFFESGLDITTADENNLFKFRGTIHNLEDKEIPEFYTLDFDENIFKKEEKQKIKPFSAYFEDMSVFTMSNKVLSIAPKKEIEVVTPEADLLKIYGVQGAVIIETSKNIDIKIYSLNGKLMLNKAADRGKHRINLPAGIYIVNENKVIVY